MVRARVIARFDRLRARLAGPVFWLAAAFALVMASLPKPPQLPGAPSDKVQHILAFAVLTVLSRLAWPALAWWKLLLCLSLYGALIEVIQLIPVLHRSADIVDWAADTGAVAVMLVLTAGARRGWARLS